MTNEQISRFLECAAFKLPKIIKSRLEDKSKRELYNDYALLVFELPEPMTMEKFCGAIDDSWGTETLYRHIRSSQTDFGRSICAFQEPGTGEMFQLCASTNPSGEITYVDVKVFYSMERMMAELQAELKRMHDVSGESFYHLTEDELVSYFI